MIYSIDSFIVVESNKSVTFVRAGDTLGWYTFIDGKQYGDCVTSKDKITTMEQVVTIFEALCDQAAATIAKIDGRPTQFEAKLALGLREQIKSAAS